MKGLVRRCESPGSWESVVWGSWVSRLELGNSQLVFACDSPHAEFHVVTRKERNQSKIVLGNRYVLHWDEIKDSKLLEKSTWC